MDLPLDPAGVDLGDLVARLRRHRAAFAFLHGSRATGRHRPDSDLDVAAMLPPDVDAWGVDVPSGVDLVSLRMLPLSVAGRIAVDGLLLFDDDPAARVRWQADVRQRWFDEAHRRRWITADALEGARRG